MHSALPQYIKKKTPTSKHWGLFCNTLNLRSRTRLFGAVEADFVVGGHNLNPGVAGLERVGCAVFISEERGLAAVGLPVAFIQLAVSKEPGRAAPHRGYIK